MAKAKKQSKKEPNSAEASFEKQLKEVGLGDALKLAAEYENDVEVLTTGYPGLDHAIDERGINAGIPLHRHSEVFSKKEHAGKTSLALGIGKTWQDLKKSVGIIQIEGDVTKAYLKTLGYVIDAEEAARLGVIAVRLLQPTVRPEDCTTEMVYLEKVLDLIAKAADVFDLLIIDSVDALVSEAEAEKTTKDNDQAGGIAKKLRAWFRKNTTRRAHVMWLNHAGQNIGGYGTPTFYTSGGKSVPRYSSLRLELAVIEKLKEGDKDPYGFITRVSVLKNRLGPNWRYVDLYYIFGEGFSKKYDYFKQAIKLGIITKIGGWFYLLGEGKNIDERKENAPWKCQGELNSYKQLTQDSEYGAFWHTITSLIDGETPEVGITQETDRPAVEDEHEEEEAVVATAT
jgi:RecA/RadA recombinase